MLPAEPSHGSVTGLETEWALPGFAHGAAQRTGGEEDREGHSEGGAQAPAPQATRPRPRGCQGQRDPGVQEEGPLPRDSGQGPGPSKPGQTPRCPCCPGSHSASTLHPTHRSPGQRRLALSWHPEGGRGRAGESGGRGVGQGVGAPPSCPGPPQRSGTGNPGQRGSRPAWGRATVFVCSGGGAHVCKVSRIPAGRTHVHTPGRAHAGEATRLDMQTPECPHAGVSTRLDAHTPGRAHARVPTHLDAHTPGHAHTWVPTRLDVHTLGCPHAWTCTCWGVHTPGCQHAGLSAFIQKAVRLGAPEGLLGGFQGAEEVWAVTAQQVQLPLG